MKPRLKAPGSKRLKLKYDILLSSFAFKCNMCRYIMEGAERGHVAVEAADASAAAFVEALPVGRCRLTLSNPSPNRLELSA